MQQQSNTDLNSESQPSLVERFFGTMQKARFSEFDDELLVFCTTGGLASKIWKICTTHQLDREKSIYLYAQKDDGDPGLFSEMPKRS
jgi:protein tyrosine phosphatase (PTP) superfamily phosphohydrolase (DUF442 family)